MNTLTRTAIQQHLGHTRAALDQASQIPVEHSLILLQEALNHLEAAVDTLHCARAEERADVRAH